MLSSPSGKIYVSRNVVFDENLFPYTTNSVLVASSQSSPQVAYLPSSLPSILGSSPTPQLTATSSVSRSPPTPPSSSSSPNAQQLPLVDSNPQAPPTPPQNIHPIQTRSKSNIFKPKHPSNGIVRYPLPQALLTSSSPTNTKLTSFTAASKHVVWHKAMNAEFDALLRNSTWSLVAPSPTMNIVGCKWVFCIKRNADGSIERY